MNNRFINLYRKLNLISQGGNGLPIHRFCTNAAKCWDSSNERFPPDDDKISHICQPWIGSEYDKLKLVVIGENLNEYGGIDSLIELTNEAKDLIAEGDRRVRFHSAFHEYARSFLWHRLGCYSAALGEAMGAMELLWEADGYPNAENVAKAFDFISFLEHIKCAPFGNNGTATTGMWENCGSHILRQELLLLKPTQLLVLGSSNNSWYLQENVFDSILDKKEFDSVIREKVTINNLKILVWIVPHPQSYGGAAKSILDDLKKALQITKVKSADR
jgi:hypothetical protein